MHQILTNSQIYAFIVLPLVIFLARICDVTLGTIRIIFVSRGDKVMAPLLGFFEVFIWIIAIGQIMSNAHGLIYYVAYAGGFAAGNYVGLLIEEKIAIGILGIQIITTGNGCRLKEKLAAAGYGVTSVDAEGSNGHVKMIYTIIKRKELNNAITIINKCSTKMFYTIEDIRTANSGIFPSKRGNITDYYLDMFRVQRLIGSSNTKK